ncbi:hypothetical protein PGT21_026154 [Puccinia graminis f. sp. tritici]|uniref:Uncharacterized protein n=1 Tax=Puccinia graminis f. sp. tritici TaxID=56615 RepID=A0A5B0MAV3_PUCGR|nr:hypothetical protein PGT21_026154 [Puccinia graminis f. sp. tritici]
MWFGNPIKNQLNLIHTTKLAPGISKSPVDSTDWPITTPGPSRCLIVPTQRARMVAPQRQKNWLLSCWSICR